MAAPRATVSGNSLSVGHPARLVQIQAITPDGATAVCIDRAGTEVRVPMYIQPGKGALPEPGEWWVVTQDISSMWTFSAITSQDGKPFLPPPSAPPTTPPAGSIPGSALEPGSVTGKEIAPQTITNLHLAAAAAATNVIIDSQFTSSGINAVRIADPGTTCTWTLATPNAAVAGTGAGLCALALMPSTLIPLYVNPGEQYYLSVSVTLPGGTGPGVSAGIQLALNDGSFLGPLLPVSGITQTVAQLVTIPPGVASCYVRLIITGLPSGTVATFTAPTCYITQGPSQMQPGSVGNSSLQANSVSANNMQAGSVSTNALQANSVVSSKIAANQITAAQLVAGIVVAGIVDATTITGSTLQNSTADPRTSINPDGSFTITNAAGVVIFKIAPDGTIYWYTALGQLQQEIQPPGTQLVYQSTTGPFACDFEVAQPAVLIATNSAVSSATYANVVGTPVPATTTVTVIASANGATAATGVADSAGNTYALVQSQTANTPYQQVFQSVIATRLTAADTITVTFAAANTQNKNIIALATAGLLFASTPLDYSAAATGTSTAPAVSGTPTAWGDTVLFILTNAGAAGPTAVADAWSQITQVNQTGTQTTSVYYSGNIASSGAFPASATLGASGNWNAVTIGYLPYPPTPFVPNAPVPLNASLATSTQWSDDGNFSCRITKTGTAAQWGITFPPFAVSPNSPVSMYAILQTGFGGTAWAQGNWGFTFFSGPNGTGTNLGSASFMAAGGPYYNLTANVAWILTYSTTVPAGAQSAVSWFMEYQADTAGNYITIDNLRIPGGLIYSNSPYSTIGPFGNQVDQGLSFYGQPGLTNVFGVKDPYKGTQLMSIDSSGDVQAQTLSTATDLLVGGKSLLNDLLPPPAQGLVNYGYIASPFPSSGGFGTTETALWELDCQLIGGRIYEFVMNPTSIGGTGAASYPQAMHLTLRYTSDGSQPTTSSSLVTQVNMTIPAGNMGHGHPGLRCQFFPNATATYRFLVSGWVNSGTFNFSADPFIRCFINDLGSNTGGQGNNNIIPLGTGSVGTPAPAPQNYTEYFNAQTTWAFWEYGQRNQNGTMYQGAYGAGGGGSGPGGSEGYAEHSWIQWGFGSLGNGLNTVLNYSVQQVQIRLTNQHSWYNSGATVSFHSATGHAPNQGLNGVSVELQNWHINEGQTLWTTLTGSAWAPFKAGGVTYAVLHPPNSSLDLGYYSYYAGQNGGGSAIPQLMVKYSH